MLQSVGGGFIQKACEVWITSSSGFSADAANLMLRSFLLGLSSGETPLPFGIASVPIVSVGSGFAVPMSLDFTTVSCGTHKQKVSSSSTSCECARGYESTDEDSCVACEENFYKPSISDDEKCIRCPDGAVSETASQICVCDVEEYVLDEKEMLCRDANGNVYRDAFTILGFDGLFFILAVSGGFLVLLFIVVYYYNGGTDDDPKAPPLNRAVNYNYRPIPGPFAVPPFMPAFSPFVTPVPNYQRF